MPEEHDDDWDEIETGPGAWLAIGIVLASITAGFWLCMLFFR